MSREQMEKKMRKAEMAAQNNYDWGKLVFPRNQFLESSYQEEREEVIFTYDITGYQEFTEIKKEKRETVIVNLIDCARLEEVSHSYKIELNPENIFYNLHNQVAVMFRDVYGKGEEFREDEFLNQYRALVGFALQDKYSYEDYRDGGMELLNKDKFLEKIAKQEKLEEIVTCLREEYERLVEEAVTTKITINKRKYRRNKIFLAITSVLVVVLAGVLGYEMLWEKPYQDAVIEANKSYLKINYSGVIEAFRDTDTSRLSVYDKYILAYSYVQSENLTEEQKKNITSALSLETNEKVLDYWIALGRLDVSEAENIAQQVSDNDLLLYAYLKEKNMLEADTSVSGEEKVSRLDELSNKIEQLSNIYEEDDTADTQDSAQSTDNIETDSTETDSTETGNMDTDTAETGNTETDNTDTDGTNDNTQEDINVLDDGN